MKNNSLQMRDARLEELDEVSQLIRDAYQQYKNSIPEPSWKIYVENITDVRSRLKVSELIVAEMNRRLVGTVTLYLKASSSSQEGWPGDWAGIRLLAVHPRYRSSGIGRALIEECIRRCRKHGIATIGLHTTELMDIARRIYERMGFERVLEFDFHPAPGVVVMAYQLDL